MLIRFGRLLPRRLRGASGLTFGLLLGLIAVTAVAATTRTGSSVEALFCTAAQKLRGASAEACGTRTLLRLSDTQQLLGMVVYGPESQGQPRQIRVENPASSPSGPFSLSAGDPALLALAPSCPASLPAGGSCTVTVTPATDRPGLRQSQVVLTENARPVLTAPASVEGEGRWSTGCPATHRCWHAGVVCSAPASTYRCYATSRSAGCNSFSVGTDHLWTQVADSFCVGAAVVEPTATGPGGATLTLTGGGELDSLSLAGPATSLAPITLTLSNSGSGPSGSLQVVSENRSNFPVTTTCGASLPASQSCSITLTPTAGAPGTFTGSLSVLEDGVERAARTLTLTATGSFTSGCPATHRCWHAGVVCSAPASTYRCYATSRSAGCNSFSVGTDHLWTQVADSNCVGAVVVEPSSTPSGASVIGVSAPDMDGLTRSGGSTGPAQSITVSNTGTGRSGRITAASSDPAVFPVSGCGAALSPGQSCTVTVTPTGSSAGTWTGEIQIREDSTSRASLSIGLTVTVPPSSNCPATHRCWHAGVSCGSGASTYRCYRSSRGAGCNSFGGGGGDNLVTQVGDSFCAGAPIVEP